MKLSLICIVSFKIFTCLVVVAIVKQLTGITLFSLVLEGNEDHGQEHHQEDKDEGSHANNQQIKMGLKTSSQ